MSTPADVESYISGFPEDVQEILNNLREIVRTVASQSVEGMAYGMPGYKLNKKPLIYFAAYAKHIGLYATPTGHEAFQADLAGYKQGKGSVQCPLSQPMPYDLIERIVKFRVEELTD